MSKLPVEKLKVSKKPIPVRIVSEPIDSPCSTSDAKYEARERKYKAEDALRTMQRAEEIKKDKQLVKDMKNLAREQMSALSKVAK